MVAGTLGNCPSVPASFTNGHTARPSDFNARQGAVINSDLEDFVEWINGAFSHPGADLPIPNLTVPCRA
ncbi:hypothetical protein ACH4CE_33775 [Streptomyces gelaticus]|uniref:hypothetical protein n=1 Tax=Streptomyces gelaticus TaxID=285446 RepID=UPI00379B85CF